MQVDTMCIIGAGTMGTGIAQLAAQAGIRVHLIDAAEEALSRSRTRLDRSLQGAVDREKLTTEQAEAVRQMIWWEADLAPCAGADWVVEAVFEDINVKGEILKRLGALVRPGVSVSSNTSTICIHRLAALYREPERLIGMHFFNPPPVMKLVEVIPWEGTAPDVTQACLALCTRMGREPMLSPDIPGFVVNRVLGALAAAAIDVWSSGGDPEAIDRSVELGLGHKMGPLKTCDLVGLDIMAALLASLHEQTGDPRFRPPDALLKLVGEGKLGAKSGAGFTDYDR